MFPGDFTTVTISSSTQEFYTNITWGIRPQPFTVDIADGPNSCGNASFTANGGVTYKWDAGDTPNQAANTFHTSGTYLLTVTNASGCVTSASKNVSVNTTPVPVINGNTTNCNAVSLTASGGGTNGTYLWSGGNSPNSSTNTFTTSGTYTVTVTTSGGCTGTSPPVNVTVSAPPAASISGATTNCNSVTLTAGGGTGYLWSGGNTPGNATNTFTTSGIYSVTVTGSNGCTATTSANVTVTLPPVITITGNFNGCVSTTLTAGGGTNYLWSGGSNPNSAANTFTTSGTYTVTVIGSNGCSATLAPINILITQPPVASITGVTSDCNNVTLTAHGGVSYLWDGGDTPTQAVNTFHASGVYNVVVTDANGCSATTSSPVTILGPIPVIIGSTTGCTSVTLTATGGTGYTWTGGSSPNSATNTFTTSGPYTVRVTNATSCIGVKTVDVIVALPVPVITGSAAGCGSVTLTASGGISYVGMVVVAPIVLPTPLQVVVLTRLLPLMPMAVVTPNRQR
jgi:hypothetical protein